ncbi:MAG: hypothetical protein KGM17_14085 [Sphingomonadales bacterium]|nr:hypothetical protein [Sphingomonadales bacterium]
MMRTAAGSPDRGAVMPAGWRAVAALWLGLALALLAFSWPAITALRATDPDDYMRLLEVRDWLAGQAWSDVHQARMGGPGGTAMHWSRLVDLPIAALLAPARLVLAEPAASALAMAGIPLLELLVAMLLLHRLVRGQGMGEGTALAAAALPLLFPVLTGTFMPMRIDHHGWQAICALACVLALQRRDGAAWAGAIAGTWLTISLEGLPLAVALAALMALRWWRARDGALAPFCLGLAGAGIALGLAMRGPAALLAATADQLSWPQLLAFALAGLLALGLPRAPWQRRRAGRAIALAAIAAAGGAAILGGLGTAAFDPFHGLDPLVRGVWLEQVREGLPIWRQDWSTRAMLAWTPMLVGAGWWAARHDVADAARWDEHAAFALAACGLSLLLMRGAVAAQLLAVPFSAALLARLFPRAAALRTAPARMAAMVACLVLLTPNLASAAGKWLDRREAVAGPATAGPADGTCALERLAGLPPSHLFAPIDLGPEILVRTGHSVVAGAYHRNRAGLHDVIAAFSGDPAGAAAIVRGNRAGYLVLCASPEVRLYAGRRPDGLAARLLAGRAPGWLVPVPGFGRGLLVWRVR